MILDLTIENLLKSGLNIQEATELFNTTGNYNLQCNSGNFWISKLENKFYTGIDFYRITYFNNGSLSFPIKCVDLVPEYFDLALNEFLEKQKTILGILYNETDQFNKFISNEIESSQVSIENYKALIKKVGSWRLNNKENDIQIRESYINYLKGKQLKAVISDEVKKEFKDFFKATVEIDTINKIENEFKDYNGKKMAVLIYLLENEFKFISYSLDSKTDSRKHLVNSLNNREPNMQPINKFFVTYSYKLDITNFESDKDFINIKEKLLETIK